MKFKSYLIEDRRMEQAKKSIAKRVKVDPKYLEFIGKDVSGYYFNITDKKHREYKSTKFERI
jgi:hypothetical protein